MVKAEKQNLPKRLTISLLLLVILAGFILRTWNINFDKGIGSHPDERSTACFYATRIHLPHSWNEFWDPHQSPLNPLWNVEQQAPAKFTYGHFPLYLGVAAANVFHWLAPLGARLGFPATTVDLMARANTACDALAVAGRLVIALLDTLTILLLYLLGAHSFGRGAGLLAAAFYAFTAQAIQLSHFFAMDPASTTFTVLAVLGGVIMVQKRTLRAAALTGLGAGLAISSKFSALPVLLVPVMAGFLVFWTVRRGEGGEQPAGGRDQFVALIGIPLALAIAGIAFFVTSPYAILDWKTFIDATLIEQGRMVRGVADFPFTRQYRNTLPYIYFIQQQVEWGLWWPLGLVTLCGVLYMFADLMRTVYGLSVRWVTGRWRHADKSGISQSQAANVVIWTWVFPYFAVTGAFLAKFNRYMSPILPFAVLFAAAMIGRLWANRRMVQQEAADDATAGEDQRPIVRRVRLKHVQRALAVALAAVGLGGGIFWSLAYVNGVYGHEHTWITASRWIYENAPRGSTILWELWDDPLPKTIPGEPGMDMGSHNLRNIDWSPYEEDTRDKYEILKAKLREADYVVYSSKRIYDSVDELPERYPMTNLYYQSMWNGKLGFDKALDWTSPPRLFGLVFQDRHADESWSLYDHPQVTVFRKVRNLSDAQFDAIFAGSWEKAKPGDVGKGSALNPILNLVGLGSSPQSEHSGLLNKVIALIAGDTSAQPAANPAERKSLMLGTPLAQLPVVDNYRWNRLASENTALSIAFWWLVVALLGWFAWPLCFEIFRSQRDRGYLVSRTAGWLIAGWVLWILASNGLAYNTVQNAWLVALGLGIVGYFTAKHRAPRWGGSYATIGALWWAVNSFTPWRIWLLWQFVWQTPTYGSLGLAAKSLWNLRS